MTPRGIALLDVNVLVALFFANHVHHDLAHDWFEDHGRGGWATCPVTENGFVRVACRQPASTGPLRPSAVIKLLARFCSDSAHHTWTDDVSLTDTSLFAPQFVRGHGQITDVYLLGLAKRHGGHLATFDRSIPLEAVRGASSKTVAIIGAVE